MLTLLFFIVAVGLVYRGLVAIPVPAAGKVPAVLPAKKVPPKLVQLSDYAERLYLDKKYLSAEKAYLEILKVDHKNAAAYTRLGMIYSHLKNLPDAIECFRIATQMLPSASSYYNLGLVYFENRNFIKSVAAFEKSIMFEQSAARYVGLAKAYQRLANNPKVIASLEKACELEPSKPHLRLLAEAYLKNRDKVRAAEVQQRLNALV